MIEVLLTCQQLQVQKIDSQVFVEFNTEANDPLLLPVYDLSEGYAFIYNLKKNLLMFEPVSGNWVLLEDYQGTHPQGSFQSCF